MSPNTTDLEMWRIILREEPDNIMAKEYVDKITGIGKEWRELTVLRVLHVFSKYRREYIQCL